jgi:pentatricopeptide repeat protein
MYTACIDAYKSSNWEVARMERAIYMVSNSILIGYAQQGDMVNAKKYYQQIKALNRYPDGNGYASLLLGSAKCATDEATDALIIYDEAKRHDVKPTTFFYNVVISKLAKARKLESAMRLFEEMQSFDIMPNSITYGAIISASVRAGSETLACKLFSDMIASSQPPRVGPFNNMIQFYVRQQPDREKALSYFAELRRCRIKPSAHTYKLLMEAYCSIAPYDMPTAYRMLSEMELRDRIHPSATHYATLIYSYGILQRDVRSADRVFEEMSKKHVAKDEVVYQAILDTLISNDQMERAEELYVTMRTEIARSSCPYIENVFIRGYGQRGHLEKARHMFDAMSDDKINHSNEVIREPSTFEAMVRAYADNDQVGQAKQVFELMVQREFPEKVTAVVAELVSNA